jgi:predicted Zn-dependent protease
MKTDHQFEIDFCHSILKQDPDDLVTMELMAGYCTRAGRIDEGLEWDRRIVQLDPENAVGHYNLACSLALKNRSEEAIDRLRVALEKGYRDLSWMLKDPDLASLHTNPGFSSLLAEFQNRS